MGLAGNRQCDQVSLDSSQMHEMRNSTKSHAILAKNGKQQRGIATGTDILAP
jgi:hypothetical protein